MNSVIVTVTLILNVCLPNCKLDAKTYYTYVDSDDSGPYLHWDAKNRICTRLKRHLNSKRIRVKHCFVREATYYDGLGEE